MLRPVVCALLFDLLQPEPEPVRPTWSRASWLPTLTLRFTLAPRGLVPRRGAPADDDLAPGATFELRLSWPLAPTHTLEDP